MFWRIAFSGGIKPTEWLPIVFGLVAGVVLLFAGALAARNRSAATILANVVFIASIVVGVLGAYFHLNRTVLLDGDLISLRAVSTLIWAPPAIGPMFFVLIGVLGISAAWIESPADSGRLRLLGERTVQMPYSKTRAYMLIVALFVLATLISSVLDHARLRFENPWVWLPLAAALFGLTTSLFVGVVEAPSSADLATHVAAMLLLIAVGLVGFLFHAEASTTSAGQLVIERFFARIAYFGAASFRKCGRDGIIAIAGA